MASLFLWYFFHLPCSTSNQLYSHSVFYLPSLSALHPCLPSICTEPTSSMKRHHLKGWPGSLGQKINQESIASNRASPRQPLLMPRICLAYSKAARERSFNKHEPQIKTFGLRKEKSATSWVYICNLVIILQISVLLKKKLIQYIMEKVKYILHIFLLS